MRALLSRIYKQVSSRPKLTLFTLTTCTTLGYVWKQPQIPPPALSYVSKIRSLSTARLVEAAVLTDVCRFIGRLDGLGLEWITGWAFHRKAELLSDEDQSDVVVVEIAELGMRVKDVIKTISDTSRGTVKAIIVAPGRMVSPDLLARMGRALVAGQKNWMRYLESLNRVEPLPWEDPAAIAEPEDLILFDRLIGILAYLCEATSELGVELVLREWHLSAGNGNSEENYLQCVALLHIALCLTRAFAPRESPFENEKDLAYTVRLAVEWSPRITHLLQDIIEESPLKDFTNQLGLQLNVSKVNDQPSAFNYAGKGIFNSNVVVAYGLDQIPAKARKRSNCWSGIEYLPGIGDLQASRLRKNGKDK